MPLMTRVLAAGAVLLNVVAAAFAAYDGRPAKVVGSLAVLTFPVVGVVIARSQPRNTVGWAFLVSSLCIGMNNAGDATSRVGQAHGWSDALVHLLAWSTAWAWFPGIFLPITLGLLHFPDGRPLSRRWRWLDVAAVALMVVFSLGIIVVTWSASTSVLLSSAAPKASGARGVLLAVSFGCVALMLPVVVGAFVSLFVRFRRSTGIARLQIRWVVAAGLLAISIEVAVDVVGSVGVHLPDVVQTLGESLGFSLIAVATGVAIRRYRLYDIDRVVSRTVGYAVVTALLLGTYVGIVAVAGTVIPARSGSVGVAAATLAVAALFVPARRRIQRAVDRRFDRARYDGQRIVDAFAVHVRSELGAVGLDAELLRTVRAAVAPSTASVWLAPSSVAAD